MPPKQSTGSSTPKKMSAPQQNGSKAGTLKKSTKHERNDQVAARQKREYEAESDRLDRERRQHSAAAARKALELQKQAHELTQAALATADAGERQKLISEALNKLVEAGSLGKVAKYLTTGTCQGMLAGGGIGTGIGIGLGTLVGVLVGGVTGIVLGGLGTGIGALVGVLHGPWFKPGEVVAKGIGKVTGAFLPDWEATPEQKYRLEKMIGQANELDRPSDDELEALTAGDSDGWLGDVQRGNGPEWTTSASWFPGKGYVKGLLGSGDDGGQAEASPANDLKDASPGGANGRKADGSGAAKGGGQQQKPARRKPAKLEVRSQRNGSD